MNSIWALDLQARAGQFKGTLEYKSYLLVEFASDSTNAIFEYFRLFDYIQDRIVYN